MKQITLDYIRGFFDGEGSIGITKKRNGRIGGMMSIVNTDKEIIDTISEKLSKLNIKHRIFSPKKPKGLGKKKQYILYISGVYGCYQFFKNIGTCSRAKQERFDKIIKSSIRLKWILRAKKYKPIIKKLREQKITQKEIAKKLGLTIDVVADIEKRMFKYF